MLLLLFENPSISISLACYTDIHGSAQSDKKLSEDRAKTVADYLESHGIKQDRITLKGYGHNLTVAPTNKKEGRQLNERLEVQVINP